MSTNLTERQRRFVEAYVGKAEGNATEAARLAGYSHETTQGPRLLENVGVREAIEAARKPRTKRAIATREERQEFLTRVMNDEDDSNDNGVEMRDRLKACELLSKMQGDFIERREVEHKGAAVSFVFESNGRGPAPED